MTQYIAKRLRFRNGERLSVLQRSQGLPVHEATLFLDTFRTRGRSANTIHFVCSTLVIVHRELDIANIDLLHRLKQGRFLTRPELNRLASATQFHVTDRTEELERSAVKAISIHSVHPKLNFSQDERLQVDAATMAKRLGYIAGYLEFLADYVKATLPELLAKQLASETKAGLKVLRAEIPPVRRRNKIGARTGLSQQEQDQLIEVVHPDSPQNPWKRGFVRRRNWIIIVLLLATGMRRGELLGLQIKDLDAQTPKLKILRRADTKEDPRLHEPNTKTNERQIEIAASIMRVLWRHINEDRHAIVGARKYPQIFVSDEGVPLSLSSIDLMFRQLREACSGLSVRLTSHVMRHTWNERFSEQADALGLSPEEEQRARNEQQGWSENSQMSATYTRRHTTKKGRQLSLRLQEKLHDKINTDN